MAKKKINPKDLQLNEEVVNRSVTPKDDSTVTYLSEDGCKSARADQCYDSLGCPTEGTDCSEWCQNTQSLGVQCCDESQKCPHTVLCPVPESITACLVTEVNCLSENDCVATNDICVAETKDCVGETYDACPIQSLIDCTESVDICALTRDDSCNQETNDCMAP